jgi:hypothetical protein
MVRRLSNLVAIAMFAVAAPAIFALPAIAAGPFDGTWTIDAPPSDRFGDSVEGYACPALRLPFQVKDNKVTGRLAWTTTGHAIEASNGQGSSPVSGTVQPDGTFTLRWESFHAAGKMTGNALEIHWKGECGPRVAKGTRAS